MIILTHKKKQSVENIFCFSFKIVYLGVYYLFSPSSPFYYYYYYYYLLLLLFILDYYMKYSKLHIANTGKRYSCVTEMNQGKALIWNSSLNDILLSNATLQDTLTLSLNAIETVGLLKKSTLSSCHKGDSQP